MSPLLWAGSAAGWAGLALVYRVLVRPGSDSERQIVVTGGTTTAEEVERRGWTLK